MPRAPEDCFRFPFSFFFFLQPLVHTTMRHLSPPPFSLSPVLLFLLFLLFSSHNAAALASVQFDRSNQSSPQLSHAGSDVDEFELVAASAAAFLATSHRSIPIEEYSASDNRAHSPLSTSSTPASLTTAAAQLQCDTHDAADALRAPNGTSFDGDSRGGRHDTQSPPVPALAARSQQHQQQQQQQQHEGQADAGPGWSHAPTSSMHNTASSSSPSSTTRRPLASATCGGGSRSRLPVAAPLALSSSQRRTSDAVMTGEAHAHGSTAHGSTSHGSTSHGSTAHGSTAHGRRAGSGSPTLMDLTTAATPLLASPTTRSPSASSASARWRSNSSNSSNSSRVRSGGLSRAGRGRTQHDDDSDDDGDGDGDDDGGGCEFGSRSRSGSGWREGSHELAALLQRADRSRSRRRREDEDEDEDENDEGAGRDVKGKEGEGVRRREEDEAREKEKMSHSAPIDFAVWQRDRHSSDAAAEGTDDEDAIPEELVDDADGCDSSGEHGHAATSTRAQPRMSRSRRASGDVDGGAQGLSKSLNARQWPWESGRLGTATADASASSGGGQRATRHQQWGGGASRSSVLRDGGDDQTWLLDKDDDAASKRRLRRPRSGRRSLRHSSPSRSSPSLFDTDTAGWLRL